MEHGIDKKWKGFAREKGTTKTLFRRKDIDWMIIIAASNKRMLKKCHVLLSFEQCVKKLYCLIVFHVLNSNLFTKNGETSELIKKIHMLIIMLAIVFKNEYKDIFNCRKNPN